jgi:WD40 repeat protein
MPSATERVVGRDHKLGEVYRLRWYDDRQNREANTWWSMFTADGSAFLVGGDGGPKGDIRMWDVATGSERRLIPGGEPWFSSGVLLPGGKKLLSWYANSKELLLWTVATGEIIRRFAGPTAGPITVAVSSDGKVFLAGGNDKVITLYDFDKGTALARLAAHEDKCSGVFSPDGKRVLTYGTVKTLRLWAVDGGTLLHKLEGHTGDSSGAFAPDGKQVLSYGADKTVRLWNTATGQQVRSFAGPAGEVTFAAFLPGGERIVAWGKDKKVRVWSAATGDLLREWDLGRRANDAPHVALAPDGRRLLASNFRDAVYLLELETGNEVHRFNAVAASGLSFSPDGRYAAAGSYRASIYLWRLPEPDPVDAPVARDGVRPAS